MLSGEAERIKELKQLPSQKPESREGESKFPLRGHTHNDLTTHSHSAPLLTGSIASTVSHSRGQASNT